MQLLIDPRYQNYRGFWRRGLGSRLTEILAERGWRAAITELCAAWRAASAASQLPGELICGIQDGLDSLYRFHKSPPGRLFKWLEVMIDDAAGPLNRLDERARKRLRRMVRAKTREIELSLKVEGPPPSAQEVESYWKKLLQSTDFRLFVWMSQLNACTTLYFAFEDFVTAPLRQRNPDYRVRRAKDLVRDLAKLVEDPAALEQCLARGEIKRARLIRNAIVHAGGRVPKQLQQQSAPHQLRLTKDGRLAIWPADVEQIYQDLKSAVLTIAPLFANH